MATKVTGLCSLQGSDFEDAYMKEVGNFKDARLGVPGDDVDAAMILRDAGEFELLRQVHQGEIHVVGQVDTDFDRFEDLIFESRR